MALAAPFFVAEYESAWNTSTTPKTASVTVEYNDVLVVYAMTQDDARTVNPPTGGTNLTWTLRQSVEGLSNYSNLYIWTARASVAETFTLSLTASGTETFYWGFNCLRFAGVGSIGASAKANGTGAPSLDITTTQNVSAVVVANADWDALDGASRTWRSGAGAFTERTYASVGAYTVYGGHHSDAGTAGTKTVGLSAPSGQTYSIAAVELLGVDAKRLYPTNTAAGYVPATLRGAWDDTGTTVKDRALAAAKSGAVTAVSRSETSSTTDWDVLLGRWVSTPLPVGGSLAGTIRWVLIVSESDAAMNAHTYLRAHVIAGDSDTVRGTLKNVVYLAEWPTTDTAVAGVTNLSTVACEPGDRIVVEFGYRAQNTSATSFTGAVGYGGTGTDLVSGDTDTLRSGWFEFSDLAVLWTPVVGLASEADTATAVNYPRVVTVGRADEADSATGVTRPGILVGQAVETDTAGSVRGPTVLVGQAVETDTALAAAAAHVRSVGLATETDTTPLLGPVLGSGTRPGAPPAIRELMSGSWWGTSASKTTTSVPQVGDLLVCVHSIDVGKAAEMLSPAGTAGTWTLRATGDRGDGLPKVKVWTRPVTVAGAQIVTIRTSVAYAMAGVVYVITGHDTTTPIDAAAGGSGTGAEHVAPSVAAAGVADLLIAAYSTKGAGDYPNPPPGMGKTAEADWFYVHTLAAFHQVPVTGTTGTRTATFSKSVDYASATAAVRGLAPRTFTIGQALETDSAFGAGRPRSVLMGGPAQTTDTATPVGVTRTVVVAMAAEADTARNVNSFFGATRVHTVLQAPEADTAQPVAAGLFGRPRLVAVTVLNPPGMRVIAQRNTGEWLDWDLDVTNLEVTLALSAPAVISGVIAPDLARLRGPDGAPLLEPHETWLYVEDDGIIRAAGLVRQAGGTGPELTIEAEGYSSHAHDWDYLGDYSREAVDVFDVVRELWRNVQSFPGSAIGVTLSPNLSGARLGTEKEKTTTTQPDGSTKEEEKAKPYQLNWWNETNCGEEINKLATATPFDFTENPTWNTTRTAVLKPIALHYPRVGRRRDDLRFATGENVLSIPELGEDPDAYRDYMVGRGAGDGSAMVFASTGRRHARRVSRMGKFTDKSITDKTLMSRLLNEELERRRAPRELGEVVVDAHHPNAPVGSYAPGDDLLFTIDLDWFGEVVLVQRCTALTISRDTPTVSIQSKRSDSFTYRAESPA